MQAGSQDNCFRDALTIGTSLSETPIISRGFKGGVYMSWDKDPFIHFRLFLYLILLCLRGCFRDYEAYIACVGA